MLARARTICPRCPRLQPCPTHANERRRQIDQHRGSARERGYDTRWDKARASYLKAHPLCTRAARGGRVQAAEVVDHIMPHRGNRALFWDSANWQSLSMEAHSQKTAKENGLIPCDEHGQGTATVRSRVVCRDCGRDVEPML